MNNTNKENIKQDSKLVSEENKAKAVSFLQSLFIGSLRGLKACIEALHDKLLPKINAKLDSLESAQKDTQ